MKKLLAAVTSFAMSASLMTSAFASSFNVSAAGRVSAVQPNVSIGEVADVAVNKTAQADFVVTPEEVSVNAGESVKVKIFADAGSHKVGTLVVGLDDSDLPQGITADVAEADLRCKAVDGSFTFNKLNGRYYCDTLDSGEPMSLASDKAVIAFTLSVPSSAKAGDYEYNLSHFHVVEDGYNGVEFDATIKPGVIHILGEGETTAPTNTTTQAPSNETTAPNVTTVSVPHEGEFEVDSKFIITPADATVAAGDTVSVNIMCENGSNRKAAQFVAQVINANLPISGATATMTSLRCSAIATKPEYSELNGTWYCDTLDSGEPQEIDTSKAVAKFDITVPSNATPGTYEWKLDRFHVVEDGYNGVEFDATLKAGKLTVTGSGETTTAPSGETTTAPATGTKPASVDEGFIIKPEDVTVEPGQTVNIGLYCTNTSNRKVAQFVARVDDANLPISGATATMKNTKCKAVATSPEYTEIDGTWYCDCLDSGDPQTINTDEPVARYAISIPADAKPGTYTWQPDRFHVVENGYEAIEFDANIQSGKIVVLGDDDTTTTTITTTADTTAAPADSTTTTTATAATPADGKVEWKIPTVKAKAGETVKMNVVVNGASDLAVAGAQFKITPASGITFAGVSDTSAAYKADIQKNDATNEFAFAEGKGAATAAADGAVVLTISYKVPAGASGTYPVKWSDAFVSDTNGNDITDKVTLTDGAIVVSSEGGVTWEIPTVHAKAGKTATLNVKVSDPDGEGLAVAGAQFNINAKTVQLSSVSGSDAYKSDIVNNKNEFAFGEGKGAGVAAADGDSVMVLTFDVPAGTAPGTYDVTWAGDIYISDTDGNDITANVTLIDGAIIVDDDLTEGKVTWTIPEKHAVPGETVELDVLVDAGDENLAVGGAQFNITAKTPIAFSTATGSDGYKAELTFNKDTNEFAFAEAKGAGVEAASGSSVLKLTYTVPEGTAAGEYPVEWSNAFISDTNGNDITADVTLVDGKIIVDELTSTTSDSDSTTTADTSTTAADTNTTTASVTEQVLPVTAPAGAVIWQIQRVEAKAGETVTVPVLVLDPNDAKLAVGGAQFGVTAKAPIAYDSVSAKSDAYASDIVANKSTFEFAFANAKGAETAAANNAVVFNLTYTVPEGTAAGEYPVTWTKDFFNASNSNGEDISNFVVCIDGAIIVVEDTTTTTGETTTATATESTTSPETETTLTVAEGAIVWQAQTVTAAPGEEVDVDVLVLDPNDIKLEVGGAQFIVSCDAALQSGTGSAAYSADIQSGVDGDANRFAFAHPKGQGIAAANGAKVITLKYKVPDTAKDGDKYPVVIGELNASDTNGLDITKHIVALDGAILVKVPETTTSSVATTTATTEATTTTPVVTAPDGAIIWQIQRVEAEAGQTVTVPVLVLDPNAVNLAVGGAQFGVTAKAPIAYSAISSSDAYGSDVVANASTFEFAFANAKGAEMAAANGAVVFNLTYTVPEGTEAGEYPVTWTKDFFNASNSNGEDITNYILCLDGAIIVKPVTSSAAETSTTGEDTATTTASETATATDTDTDTTTASETGTETASETGTETGTDTETTTASETGTDTATTTTGTGEVTTLPDAAKYVIVEGTAIDGFYFNHDGRSFNKGHVTATKLTVVMSDGTTEELKFDESALSFKEKVSGEDNPMAAYNEEQTDFTYNVDAFYGGKPLEFAEGNPVTFKVYIGVKGDSNLDNKADAKDASNALAFYSKVSVKEADVSSDDIMINPDSNKIITDHPELDLDQFGAFLADVDKDVYDEDNWKTTKSGRVIDAKDASSILRYYSIMSSGGTDRQAAWNDAVSGREEKIRDFLITE